MIVVTFVYILFFLIRTAIDITIFFVIVRMILNKRSIAWLEPFDAAGHGLVAMASDLGSGVSDRLGLRAVTPNGKLLIAVLTLMAIEVVVMLIAGAFRYGL